MVKYGRGKFVAHQNYIDYMHSIVEHENYSDMPNSINEKGKVLWQVSSGKTTSFYKYYQERFKWWVKEADKLGLPGNENSDERFSTAARLIHPTKLRACRICGESMHIGYMYLAHNLFKRWSKLTKSDSLFYKGQNIVEAANILKLRVGEDALTKEIGLIFPEKKEYLHLLPDLETFFDESSHLKNQGAFISPGFMSNPPDRLDGFHDYGLCCRKKSDPGRHDENMRTYNHDRRAFMWWSEGDWIVADALYNSAGGGTCSNPNCGEVVGKISPDHVGPISCGFKQIPFFIPLCSPCNSAKNRRFSLLDVKELIHYEDTTGESVASWQVQALWDESKNLIRNDSDSKHLSNLMRSMQDYYLRALNQLFKNGFSQQLSYFLTPTNAHYKVIFEGLDTSTLQYEKYTKLPNKTKLTSSLAARSVRIAFEELEIYTLKEVQERKLFKLDTFNWDIELDEIISSAKNYLPHNEEAIKWDKALSDKTLNSADKDELILQLLDNNYESNKTHFLTFKKMLVEHFNNIGKHLANNYIK